MADPGADSRTSMAAERTWLAWWRAALGAGGRRPRGGRGLAWWRAALGAGVGALAVGRVAPEVLHVARGPYVVLGCGYGLLAIALLIAGAHRQRALQRAVDEGGKDPMSFGVVAAFTVASA